jgi:hypothetical protein
MYNNIFCNKMYLIILVLQLDFLSVNRTAATALGSMGAALLWKTVQEARR